MAESNEKEEKDSKEKKKEEPRAAGGGIGAKLLPILTAVNSLLVAAVLAVLLLRPPTVKVAEAKGDHEEAAAGEHGEGEAKGKDEKHAAPGPTLRLGDFVVHLRDTDGEHFAKISFDVEVADEKAKELINARIPQIRDTFLSYLSDRSSADFRGSESLGRIKSALVQRVGEASPGTALRGLYVTELVIQ
jgi:flagellar protein FliL